MSMDQEYVDELNRLLASASHPRTIELLKNALENASTDTTTTTTTTQNGQAVEENISKEPAADSATTVVLDSQPISRARDSSVGFVKISNYGWDQSDKFVKLYISDIPGTEKITPENIHSDFKQSCVKVELQNVSGKNYCLTINNLYGAIVSEQCSVKVKSGMVIVSVRKANKDEWKFVTAREKKLKDQKERKPKFDNSDKDDPGQGLMNLMRQMYQDGDDEMKRTIAKSWYESQEKRKNESGMNF